MSDMQIPKEQQTAYQRWEMGALFSDDPTQNRQKEKPAATAAEKLALLLETARKEAFLKGKQEGMLEGKQAGLQEGFLAGLQKGQEVSGDAERKFLALGNSFQLALKQADEKLANDLLKLALDIAKSILKTTLSVDSTKIIPIVKEVIHYLPSVQQPARIYLHPDDASTVREHIGEELREGGWHIIEDAQIEAGGCMVETASNQIDASSASRWKRISKALGHPSEWAEDLPHKERAA